MALAVPGVAGMHAKEDEDNAAWLPRYLPARQCRDDPNDPARVFVPYCMRYETSGSNRTVFGQEDGEELVCICNVCNNALAGKCSVSMDKATGVTGGGFVFCTGATLPYLYGANPCFSKWPHRSWDARYENLIAIIPPCWGR